MRPDKLLRYLSVPGSDVRARLQVEVFAGEIPFFGWLRAPGGEVIARLRDFRFDFLHFDPARERRLADAAADAVQAQPAAVLEAIDLKSHRLERVGHWYDIAGWLLANDGAQQQDALRFRTAAGRIDIHFHSHPWSGVVAVTVEGTLWKEIDLYHESTGKPLVCSLTNPARQNVQVDIRPTGKTNAAAMGRQCIIEEIRESTGSEKMPAYEKRPAVNRGGVFPAQALKLLHDLDPGQVFLDLGGGRRQIDDDRYLNMEYTDYGEPDLLGDALSIPFRSESVDVVYSSAVMEHVTNPFKFGDEIWRVLAPGGRIMINSAFMQPVHSEGMHFFNATPYAMNLVFDRFLDKQIWWEGSLSETIDWMFNVAGVSSRADAETLGKIKAGIRDLDRLVSYDKLMYIASGVWIAARKPY